MMAGDLWSRLWVLAVAYPALALVFVIILCLAGTLIALSFVSMSKPELPLDQWQDDADQHQAVSGRMPLETWRRSGGNWHGEL